MKAWGSIAYLKEVCGNHKRYNSFEMHCGQMAMIHCQ